MNMLRVFLVLTGIAGMMLFSGCKTESDYRRERAEKAVRYFERVKLHTLPHDTRLTLKDCIEMGLAHNLDLKVKHQEEDIASELRTAELLGMLPELNINDGFSGRSNTPASGSKAYASDGASYGPAQNQDKILNTFNIDLALSVMDFGLAFFNSQQAHDRVILRKKQTERMAQNLTLDIINAYCRVAAAQKAVELSRNMQQVCNERLNLIRALRTSKGKDKLSDFRAFEEIRRFNEVDRRLTTFEQDFQNACVELRSLLGLYSTVTFSVDDSFLDQEPPSASSLPDLDVLEETALIRRPELQQTEIQRHISILECRKAIVTMFPNARLFLDFNNVNNSFLYNQNWWSMGLFATINLLKLPQKITMAIAYYNQADSETMRTYGQSIAVIAQVRIAHANIRANQEVFDKADKAFKNFNEALTSVKKNRKILTSTNNVTRLELDHMELTTAESRLERNLALADYYVSFFRLMNTVGLQDYKIESMNKLPEELKKKQEEVK